jgi:[acyl-carrier-protein] S-malonyltransferase
MGTAFVFPGQGSQAVGMLAGLAEAYPAVGETFAEASERLGYDLWALVSHGPADELNRTEHTQPAMLAAGVAVWRVWQARGGPRPAMLAGHSLGEYTALVCAGGLVFGDAVELVAARGRFMQAAVPPGTGAMAAILGLEDAAVAALCAEAAEGEVLAAVNFNAPGQVVIAGTAAAVARAVAAAKGWGAKRALTLPVSVPSHCALMRPAAAQLAERLAEVPVNPPGIPVVHNVDVESHGDAESIRRVLAEQLHSPVRWVETVQYMAASGISTLVECGPGKVLTGLNKRIARELAALAIHDADSVEQALMELGD